MNNAIIAVLSTLATIYIAWLSYTVYELSVSDGLQEYQITQIHKVLQEHSE